MARPDLIIPTESGLYCPAGDFFVDPWKPVAKAVVTHAHSDHARPGSASYLCAAAGVNVLRERVGQGSRIQGLSWGKPLSLNGVTISLHPAGHILGSAQVRIEHGGDVWVLAGDYKTEPDISCDIFEPVKCRVFVTESTFGLPVYRWRPSAEIFADLNRWWASNAALGLTSIVFAYALGKAQRVLSGLDPNIGPIAVHGTVARFLPHYAAEGRKLPDALHAASENPWQAKGCGLVVAPLSTLGSPWLEKFGEASHAVASGWMQSRGARRRQSLDRGFVLSDHADWPGLLSAIEATGAERVGVTHGFTESLSRWLRENGRDSFTWKTRFEGEAGAEKSEGADAGESGP